MQLLYWNFENLLSSKKHLLQIQVSISDLRERQWYYICVEWENFNRHNESTGTDCRTLRTLDRFGKSAETSVTDVEIIDISSTTMQFRIRSIVEFPIRLSRNFWLIVLFQWNRKKRNLKINYFFTNDLIPISWNKIN